MTALAQALSEALGVSIPKDPVVCARKLKAKDPIVQPVETCEICGETGNLESQGEYILCRNCRRKVFNQ